MSRSSTRAKTARQSRRARSRSAPTPTRRIFVLQAARSFITTKPVLRLADTKLRGSHNIENLMATLAAGRARGLSFEQMVPPLVALRTAAASLRIRPRSCAASTTSMIRKRRISTRWKRRCMRKTNRSILIAGGKDKGFTFESLRELVRQKVASGHSHRRDGADASRAIGKALCRSEIADSLADAVERAHAHGEAGRDRSLFPGNLFLRHVQELCRSRRSISRARPRPAKIKDENAQTYFDAKNCAHSTRAAFPRRSRNGMDYEEMSEPNMKLSRALLIVLVLHVVAVAGIIAFNAIKTRQGGLPPPPLAKSANVKAEDASAQSSALETQKPTVTANRDEEKPKHSGRCERGTEDRQGEARGERAQRGGFRKDLCRGERRQSGHDRAANSRSRTTSCSSSITLMTREIEDRAETARSRQAQKRRRQDDKNLDEA